MGPWKGKSVLLDPMNGIAEESATSATLTPVVGGRFVRMDYTWSYHDQAQEGLLLIGTSAKTGIVSICWMDTWHMGHSFMNLTGNDGGGDSVAALGSYEVGDGSPDWGWRITLERTSFDDLLMVMNNIDPDGQEYLAVQARFERG